MARSLSLVLGLLAAGAFGQGLPQLQPFLRTGDLFIVDAAGDDIWRLQDLNLDGDHDDPGEIVEFYSDVLGPVPLTNPVGCSVGPDGTLYVVDSSEQIVLALRDLDGDGDANDLGEAVVFFDGTAALTYGGNASLILLASPQDLTVDGAGVLWVVSANTGGGGLDLVARLFDLDGDGDANDPQESRIYASWPGGAVGDRNPTDIQVGPDGFLYLVENGNAGKGLYRLHDDVVPNGVCTDPGEVTPFFLPPPLPAVPFYWGLSIDGTGAFYLADTGNDVIWRCVDLVPDFVIDPVLEATIWWTAPASSLVWRTVVADDGTVFAIESETPDRILRLRDDVVPNGHVNDPGEVIAVYDETLAALAVGNPRSLCFAKAPRLTVPSAPSLGTSLSIDLDSRAGDGFSLWFSTGSLVFPAPPFGVLRLGVFAPDVFGELVSGVLDAQGSFSLPLVVPNVPTLVGVSFTLQALVGPASRLQLTNGATVTFQL